MRNPTNKRESPLNRKSHNTCKNHPKQPKRSSTLSIPKCRHADNISESPQNSNRNLHFLQPEAWRRNRAAKGAAKRQKKTPCLTANPLRSLQDYLISAEPPAASISATSFSASSLEIPSLSGLGAPSTSPFASFRPRAVIARTALMTPIF